MFYAHVVVFSLEIFCALEVTNLHYWRIIGFAFCPIFIHCKPLLQLCHRLKASHLWHFTPNRSKPVQPGKNQVSKAVLVFLSLQVWVSAYRAETAKT